MKVCLQCVMTEMCYETVHCLLAFLGRTMGGFIIDSRNRPGLSSTTLSISSRKLSVTLRPVLADVSSSGHRHFWHSSNTSSRSTCLWSSRSCIVANKDRWAGGLERLLPHSCTLYYLHSLFYNQFILLTRG